MRRRARRAAAAEEVNAPGKLVAEEFAILHPTSADVSVKGAVNVPSADAAAQVALLVPPIPKERITPLRTGKAGRRGEADSEEDEDYLDFMSHISNPDNGGAREEEALEELG